MIDTAKAQWALTSSELSAIAWLNKNGFTGELFIQCPGNTHFSVYKGGFADTLILPRGLDKSHTLYHLNAFNTEFTSKQAKLKQKSGVKQLSKIKDLREASGMERKEFAAYFNIPYRTLQDWELKNRNCPGYVLELIEYRLIHDNKIREQ